MTKHIELSGRKYRYTIDDKRISPVSKVSAEYFHEGRKEWRQVNNWNTRERIYNACSVVVV